VAIPAAIFSYFFRLNLDNFTGSLGLVAMFYIGLWLFFPDSDEDSEPMVEDEK
jgi:hypothetical protein